MPRLKFLILKSTLGGYSQQKGFWFKDQGLRDIGIKDLFFKFLENNEAKRLKWPSTWFCDSTYCLGATPYGVRVLRAPYMIKISGLEHLTASKQMEVLEGLLDVSEGKTRSNQKDVKLEVLEDAQPSTRCLQDSATKSSGACQTPDSGTTYRHRMF